MLYISKLFDMYRGPMVQNNKKVSTIFKALSDVNRLEILSLLKEGEKCACVLLEKMNMAQSTLSYHMKILSDSNLVESRQDGKWTHYKLSKAGSEYALSVLRAITTPKD